MEGTAQGKDFELNLTVKIKTGHQKVSLVVNFRRSVIIAKL